MLDRDLSTEPATSRTPVAASGPDSVLAAASVPGSAFGMSPATAVATPEGWSALGDLGVGDEVLGRDGRVCRVLSTTRLPRDPHVPSVVLAFGNGVEVVCGPRQTWVTSDRVGRMRLRAASRQAVARWRSESLSAVSAVRRLRAHLEDRSATTAPDLLRLLRSRGITRWADVNDLRATLAPYVATVNNKRADEPAAMWVLSDVLRYLDLRLTRDVDAPFGHVYEVREIARQPLGGGLAVPGSGPLCLRPRTHAEDPNLVGSDLLISGQGLPVECLRGSAQQRQALVGSLAAASGLGRHEIRAHDEAQMLAVCELLGSLAINHRVTWMQGVEPEGNCFHIAFEHPATSPRFVPVQSLRLGEPAERRSVVVDSPDHTFLIAGLLTAHGGRRADV